MKAFNLFLSFLVLLLMVALPKAGSTQTVSGQSAAATESPEWTKKLVERKKEGIATVTLREVRAADQSEFDRVVFEFKETQVPGYRVEYVLVPVMDESERVMRLAGKAFLRVDLNPALAHSSETGAPSVKEREKRLNLSTVIEFKQASDFEGIVSYALGLKKKQPFRVMEMSNPARLVIDIKH
jgi:hypothetical protein